MLVTCASGDSVEDRKEGTPVTVLLGNVSNCVVSNAIIKVDNISWT